MYKNVLIKSGPIVLLIIIIFYYALNGLCASEENTRFAQVLKETVVSANRGSGIGDIGKRLLKLEPTVVGESIIPIAADNKGNIYVGDSLNHKIIIFDKSGLLFREIESPKEAKYIDYIIVDKKNDIYILTKNGPKILRYAANGSLQSTIDLASVGILRKNEKGGSILDKRGTLTGSQYKIVVDTEDNIYALCGDLLKFNKEGILLKRWGPNVFNFLIDLNNNLYIIYHGSTVEKYDAKGNLLNVTKQYESGKFVGSDWGIIRQPEFVDSYGCVYGFTESKDNFLGKYCIKDKSFYGLPIKQDDLISERWTVDNQGNIYYTLSEGAKFRVIKMSILSEGKK